MALTLGVAGLCPPSAKAASARKLGATAASTTVTASIVLKARNGNLLESYVASTQDPSSPNYHKFVSLPTFVATCGAAPSDIALLKNYLSSFNIQVTSVYADQLLVKATGTVDAFNKAFLLDINDYVQNAQVFHRPANSPQIPFFLRGILVTVFGPTDAPSFHSMLVKTNDGKHPALVPHKPALRTSNSIATGLPGDYTVGDVANLYNIKPLYYADIDGHGRTIGIATLANFLPSDAYAYWSTIGLKVLANRITQVHVDGGGPLSAADGSGETCLDVEQSGGLAPAAKIIVYDAPNTDPGFIDLFYKAASDNLVDSLSVSWGASEVYYYSAVSGGTESSAEFVAFHQAFLELAAQGISTFASAGDSGAYDANDAFNDPVNNVLSVDYPSSDPAITAAGGTTVPWSGQFLSLPASAPPVTVYTEQVWGWSYLQSYFDLYGGSDYQYIFFPGGGGGGVSTYWPAPAYQSGVPGVRLSEAHQSVYEFGVDLIDLPGGFAGRNLPDVSLNADPYSGYTLYCTQEGGFIDGYGGTSFVAPQLNGISALISQANGGKRLGLWNPMLYRFKKTYASFSAPPLVDVTAGNNWFYQGLNGYEPGAGLGVLDVTQLTKAVLYEGH
jgi:subtilase family serine protease